MVSSANICYVFFFKQKTAYEVRISDWSSDVCSSDLSASAAARSCPAKPLRPPIERTDPRHVAARIAGDLDPQGHKPLARVVARDRAGLTSDARGGRPVQPDRSAAAGPPQTAPDAQRDRHHTAKRPLGHEGGNACI